MFCGVPDTNKKKKLRKFANRLKGTGIYINDDYSVVTRKRIEELTPTVRRLRDQGKGAKLVKDRLITWEWKEDRQEKFVESDSEH